ncbi:MAG TPA: response regulator [Ktedonobacteraceae bacterium]|jgi:CheY-like chemotaxis protein
MNTHGRILVVEDREDWRKILVEELERAGFSVAAVDTAEKARQLLTTELYHVLILDIRLSDNDTSNTDGLHLLADMDRQGLTEAIQVMMLSAYGTREHMRVAFRDYRVADFVFKTRFNSSAFAEDVRRVFARNVCINLGMNIHWSGVSGSRPVAVNLKLNLAGAQKTTRVLDGSPLQDRVATEVDDLLRRLFHEAESILVKPMAPGRSGTAVFEVRPFYPEIGGGSPMVVKLGDAQQILQEYHNFKEFVERLVGGRRCTSVHGLRRTALLGGLIYSFLGAGDQLEDFATFYRRSEVPAITRALDQLFLTTCMEWYANASRLQLLDLTLDYQQALGFTPQKLAQAFQQLRTIQGPDQRLYIEALAPRQTFTHPLPAIAGKSLAFPTYASPTHGDLNEHNLLVDRDGSIWMIDFQGTGQGHILRDLVGLDAVIRLQLLSSAQATLEERLAMEQALCRISRFSEVEQLTGAFQTSNPALAKAYALVVHLRTLARQMVRQNPNDDFNEYYGALLYTALNTMRFKTLEQEQREHALLSASLLVDKLGLAA